MTQLLLLPGQDRSQCDAAPNAATVQHALAAAHKVMLGEIAWFRSLDDETVERIAESAPAHTPEYHLATVELQRRAEGSRRPSSDAVVRAPGA
jgi:hypothetical protein